MWVATGNEALEATLMDKRVTKEEWSDPETYGFLKGGVLTLHKSEDGKDHNWMISDGDIKGEDWIILN